MEKRETSTIIEVLGKKYKIEKYTAWVGAFIIFKLINKALPSLFAGGDAEALQALQNQMSKTEFTEFLKDVLSVVSVKKEAGFFPVLDEMGNLQIELQNDTITILLLAIHAIRFNASDFFFRKRAKITSRGSTGLQLLFYTGINEFLFLPVSHRYWQQHELWDGTYTLDDLLDVREMIMVDMENQRIINGANNEQPN